MYTYKKFGASYDVNYQGRWPVLNVSTTAPAGNRFRESWTVQNVSFSYKTTRDTSAFLSVSNLAEAGRREYIFDPSRVRSNWVIPRSLKFGITGQF